MNDFSTTGTRSHTRGWLNAVAGVLALVLTIGIAGPVQAAPAVVLSMKVSARAGAPLPDGREAADPKDDMIRHGDRVSVSGSLKRASDRAALAGKQVKVRFCRVWESGGTVKCAAATTSRTDRRGRYKAALLAMGVEGQSSTDSGYIESRYGASTSRYEFHMNFRGGIVLTESPKGPVAKGTDVRIAGRALYYDEGFGWIAADRYPVALYDLGRAGKWTVSTPPHAGMTVDDAGRFSFIFTARTDTYLQVRNQVFSGDSGNIRVDTRYRSRLSLSGPARVGPAGRFTVRGALAWNTGSEWKPLGGREVVLYRRAKGTAKWVVAGRARSDARGRYSTRLRIGRDGFVKASYAGDGEHFLVKSRSLSVKAA